MLEHTLITLTTDFGLKDPFAGIMKGVIYSINPHVKVVDISHNVQRHNIFEASQTLFMSYKYFPPGTIHVAVVDPGVGSSRRPLLLSAGDHFFIGPDNGVFSLIINDPAAGPFKMIHITASDYFLPVKGPTFHGRDIFAPVAAWLSKGTDPGEFGHEIDDCMKISAPAVTFTDSNSLTGEIVSIDSFGNAISNISKEDVCRLGQAESKGVVRVTYQNMQLSLSEYYAESRGAVLSAIINSFGYLELFVNKDDAAEKFNIRIGDSVTVTLDV